MTDVIPKVEAVGVDPVTSAPAVQDAPATAPVVTEAAQRLRFELEGIGFDGRLHPATSGDGAVLWVFGSGGGLGGPAGGVYARLGASLVSRGVTSLELDYRRLRDLESCVADVLAGVAHLEGLGRKRIVLVGHSFGGRVVIEAALRAPSVVAVAALSSVDVEPGVVERLSPRSLLLLHGEADEVVPSSVSVGLFKRAGDPKSLLLYPECLHGLDSCGSAIDRDLASWIGAVLDLPA
jgi:fermentation-respiration switch protein FrsA (DUF1100 family)